MVLDMSLQGKILGKSRHGRSTAVARPLPDRLAARQDELEEAFGRLFPILKTTASNGRTDGAGHGDLEHRGFLTRGVAGILLALYKSFPRPSTLLVSDLSVNGARTPSDRAAPRHQAVSRHVVAG